MRLRAATTAVLAAAAVAVSAAPALAAEQQTLSAAEPQKSFEGKLGSGFVYTSSVSDALPYCTPGVFDCERTLVEVKDPGSRLRVGITSDPAANPALADTDLHVYASDAAGTQGALLGESTSPSTEELVAITNPKPGFYLVVVDWYFGAGSYTGTLRLTPTA